MSLASRLMTAFVGIALIWYFWPFGDSSEVVKAVNPPPPTGHEGRLFTTDLDDEAPPDAPPEVPAPSKSADDSPKTIGDAETAGGAETADGAKTPTDTDVAALTLPAEKAKLKEERFYRVRVRDSSTLEAGGAVIELAGIDGIASDETCTDSAGATWHCGTRARMALTRFIRGRAVVCKVPDGEKTKTLTATCTLASKDLSLWMVSQGWAKPSKPAAPKLAKAADQARAQKMGIWR